MFCLRFDFLIISVVLLLFSVSVVCAQENSTVDESLSITGTYCDLEKEIDNLEPNETIKLTQDYEYNENEYDQNNPFIEIKKDNITINGNNHTLNSKNKSSFFKIIGHHVKIINLKLINAQAQLQKSNDNFWVSDLISISTNPPINWLGDYGTLENCTIQNCNNLNNGIIKIQGQNNKIENIKFINNTIKYGSTIYLKNKNNIIGKCIFTNTPSNTYIYTNETKINTSNISFTIRNIYHGSLDLDCLNHVYKNKITNITRDIIYDIYQTLHNPGNTSNINNTYTIKGDIIGTKYILTYNKKLKDNILFVKTYHISNIVSNNLTSIYNQLFNNEYYVTYALIKNMYFDNTDYESLLKLKVSDVFTESMVDYCCQKADKDHITLGLNISLTDHYTIYSNSRWDIANTGFDFIDFNGNSSTIKSSSDLRDEHTWLLMDHESGVVNIINLTITGFNTGIDNRGGQLLSLFNTVLKDNKKDYRSDMDYGGGIINTGNIFCYNCTFTGNYAKYGGAIFNQGNLEIYNCTFTSNTAYGGAGDNILNARKGNVTINGIPTLHNEDNTNSSLVEYKEGHSGVAYITAGNFISSIGGMFLSIATVCFINACLGYWGLPFTYILSHMFTLADIAGLHYSTCLIVGGIVGALWGAGVGAITTYLSISTSFDVTLNRQSEALLTMGNCIITGCIGGILGGRIAHMINGFVPSEYPIHTYRDPTHETTVEEYKDRFEYETKDGAYYIKYINGTIIKKWKEDGYIFKSVNGKLVDARYDRYYLSEDHESIISMEESPEGYPIKKVIAIKDTNHKITGYRYEEKILDEYDEMDIRHVDYKVVEKYPNGKVKNEYISSYEVDEINDQED